MKMKRRYAKKRFKTARDLQIFRFYAHGYDPILRAMKDRKIEGMRQVAWRWPPGFFENTTVTFKSDRF